MPKIIIPIGKPWSIKKIWNDSFEEISEKPLVPRDYIYASEVGYSFINVYYKMKAVQPTNYPTSVAKMKMEAGKVWEGIVRMVLKRAGIMQSAQEKVDFNLKGCLSVHGRLDFIGGGIVNLNQAAEFSIMLKALWQELDMPQMYINIADKALAYVEEMANEGIVLLETIPLEVKSVSKYVWDMIESTGQAMDYHVSQCFHYTNGKKLPKGRVIYINRDDCRLDEIDIPNNAENMAKYKGWIEQMTDYWVRQEDPPKEELIFFNPLDFKFRKKTMEIEWSPYLTLIYGFISPMAYREYCEELGLGNFNRVFKRCVDGDKMTDKNFDVIKKAKKFLPDWDGYVEKAKLKKQAGQLNLVEAIDE